ncbi:hypothetical protein [Vibrio hepatarius]|uniref:hypothetical protein n=1 Tax=Vibrio hepatarius TaxID=171383 RepID=UPI001C09C52A|nr:hypothetical protein [Vibrio hepatarius]MBU2896119.1 hypothetical protein [Vibrio hepatarius]
METAKQQVKSYIKYKNINAVKVAIYTAIIIFIFTVSYDHSLDYIELIKDSNFYKNNVGGWLFPYEWSLNALSPIIMYCHFWGLRLFAATVFTKYMLTNM